MIQVIENVMGKPTATRGIPHRETTQNNMRLSRW